MKKLLLSAALAVISTVAVLGVTEIDGIAYNLDAGYKTAEVKSSSAKYTGDVTIPDKVTYGGVEYSVTSIGDRAFQGCRGLTSVYIPNSVTSIGDRAFESCSGLTSVDIPNSVTSIGDRAFESCSGLTSITVSEGNTEYKSIDGILYSKDGKTLISYPGGKTGSVEIPSSVESIGSYAFLRCSGLTSVEIPNSVTSIGYSAFYGCRGLTSVYIPNSVTSIGDRAFESCSGLTSVNIPNSVTSIGYHVFDGCRGLTSVDIPSSVTSIGASAFEGCSGLTSVEIPNSVTSIGYSAFYGCRGLTSVNIPNSVTSIGSSAFYGVSKLESATLGQAALDYGLAAQNCSTLKSVTILEGVTSIGASAFSGCSGLTSVVIPNSVTSIGGRAFEGCSGLTSVTIPNSVKYIGEYAFNGCSGLKEVICEGEKPTDCPDNIFGEGLAEAEIYAQATLTVPSAGFKLYRLMEPWKNFDTKASDFEMNVIPSTDNATFVWTPTCGADKYTLTVYSDPEQTIEVCVLDFDAYGRLTGLQLRSSSEYMGGYSFKVSSLSGDKDYYYSMTVRDKSNNIVEEVKGDFRTSTPTGVEEGEDAVKEVYYIGMNGQRYETIIEDAPMVKVTVMQSGKVKTEKNIRF